MRRTIFVITVGFSVLLIGALMAAPALASDTFNSGTGAFNWQPDPVGPTQDANSTWTQNYNANVRDTVNECVGMARAYGLKASDPCPQNGVQQRGGVNNASPNPGRIQRTQSGANPGTSQIAQSGVQSTPITA
jgi:hypothetical protein